MSGSEMADALAVATPPLLAATNPAARLTGLLTIAVSKLANFVTVFFHAFLYL